MPAIFKKAAAILEKHLEDAEFVALGEALDNDPRNGLLDEVNPRLMVSHPEIFVDPSAIHARKNPLTKP